MNAKKNKQNQDGAVEVEISEESEVPLEGAPLKEQQQDAPTEDEDLREQLLRALAEVENTKRRAEKEKQDAFKYATANFARDLLAVADNLERALLAVPQEVRGEEHIKSLVTGVELTQKELQHAFTQHGIKKIDALGDIFDYNLHQAISETEDPSQPNGTVVEQMQSGYILRDRLLRPAMVVVAKGGGEPAPKETDNIEGIDTTA